MRLGLFRGQLDRDDVVGGVAGRGEGALPFAGLVHRTFVIVSFLDLVDSVRFEPDDRQRIEEYFRMLFRQ